MRPRRAVQNLVQAPSLRGPWDVPAPTLQFSVTGYSGFEDEILQLLNANRPATLTRRWLDWRYTQLPGVPPPKVFWIRLNDRPAVGMASLIFRRYWVNGEPRDIAVLGDISLKKDLRGLGLGRQLMAFIGRHLNSWPNHSAFVIPTSAAERCLSATGWTTAGRFVPHVFLMDPTDALRRTVRREWLARGIAALYKRAIATGLRLTGPRRASLQLVDDVDETFDTLWRQFPKRNLILRDMSQETLRWRYIRHPDHRFRAAKLMTEEGLTGYLIFEVGQQDRTCRIHDVLVKRPRDLRRMLVLFAQHVQTMGHPSSIRLVLADRHPYGRSLWKSGFLARPAQSVFQVRSAERGFNQQAWHLTAGDKDV